MAIRSVLPLSGGELLLSSGLEAGAEHVVGSVMAQVDCSVGLDECKDSQSATLLKGAAVAAILVSSSLGVLIPILGSRFPFLSPDGNFFFVTKSFAAGVILATAFVHILPDAMETLSNPCLPEKPWSKFPFSGCIAMAAAFMTLVIDFAATQYYEKQQLGAHGHGQEQSTLDVEKGPIAGESGDVNKNLAIVGLHSHPDHGHHVHDLTTPEEEARMAQIRHVVISQVLELGIVAHSVIIGVTLGVSSSPCTIKPLLAALCFHQFFEGFALGGCITQASFKKLSTYVMAFFFTITTPLGIAIGIGIENGYNQKSPKALIVQGTFDSMAAGILTYMALVDLIAADFLSKRLRSDLRLQLLSFFGLFCGAAAMSLLAIWA